MENNNNNTFIEIEEKEQAIKILNDTIIWLRSQIVSEFNGTVYAAISCIKYRIESLESEIKHTKNIDTRNFQ